MKKIKILIKAFLSLLILFSGVSSFYYLFIEKRAEINKKLGYRTSNLLTATKENDEFMAREILKGGYILFFRHAERDKWIDVQMYDAIESDLHDKGINSNRFAENEYFSDAVCLNSRGKIQARAMREVIEFSRLPVGYVESSPSCRSRQTAEIIFGGYDKLNRNLVHKGPYNENMDERNKYLKNFLLNLPIKENTNTIVSAHNGVINSDLFKNNNSYLELEEGGFYVIKNDNKVLDLVYEFHYFKDFSKVFFPRVYD